MNLYRYIESEESILNFYIYHYGESFINNHVVKIPFRKETWNTLDLHAVVIEVRGR